MGIDDFDIDPSSAEPEEWDPEEDLYDPAADGLTIPQVSTDESDVDPEIARTFWTVVLIVNAAVLFVSVGPMLWYFWGWTREGLALILGGIVLFGLAYGRYRRFISDSPEDHDQGQAAVTESSPTDASSNTAHSRSAEAADPDRPASHPQEPTDEYTDDATSQPATDTDTQ